MRATPRTAVALLIGPPTSFETNSEARIVLVLAAISSVNALWIVAIYLGSILVIQKSTISRQEHVARQWVSVRTLSRSATAVALVTDKRRQKNLNKLVSNYFVGPASVLAAPMAYSAW